LSVEAGGRLTANEIKDEIKAIKRLAEPRKTALVSALVCEFLACF